MNSLLQNTKHFKSLALNIIEGYEITKDEAISLIKTPDKEILALLDGAYTIRHHYFTNKIRLNYLLNAKSGACSQDCAYCSQSAISKAEIEKYPLVDKEKILEGAELAYRSKAKFYCIATSGENPTDNEIEILAGCIKEIKNKYPLKLCTSLGIISEKHAKILKEVGIDRFNHNLNTSERYYEEISTTHNYSDRIKTLELLHSVGIHSCSGCIVGMGETEEDLVDVALKLREKNAEAIPINFLIPIKGTPLENISVLNPLYCLKVIAMFRYCCPDREIRLAAGREIHLRSLQAMGFYAATSLFISDYLTEKGQAAELDYKMIEDLGFEIDR